jgi:quinol monooxygenase YgiN
VGGVKEVTVPSASKGAVVVLATLYPSDGRRTDVIAAVAPAIAAIHGEPGCLLYALHEGPDNTLVLVEKWESETVLDGHNNGAGRAQLRASVDGLMARPSVVTVLTPVPEGDPQRGVV